MVSMDAARRETREESWALDFEGMSVGVLGSALVLADGEDRALRSWNSRRGCI